MTVPPAPTVASIHDVVVERLAEAGQRYTEGRRELVEQLAQAAEPLAMAQLLARVPGMPLSSAYRHLTVLASCGVVHRISSGADDTGSFELTDELSGQHHHHLICATCGKITDIDSFPRLEKALNEAAELAARETGFAIDAHRIDLVGQCRDCQQ